MIKQMTQEEKAGLLNHSFDELWAGMWNAELVGDASLSHQYRQEEVASRMKFNALMAGVQSNDMMYTMALLVEETKDIWTEPEWGFPKGRRNYQENEYECAAREFYEETGYAPRLLHLIMNIYPFEEVFMGSNYKTYKHKYFLNYMEYQDSLEHTFVPNTEVSKLEWKTLQEGLESIREYNEEKIRLFHKVFACITQYIL